MFETHKPTKAFKKITDCKKRKVFVSLKSSHKVRPSYWDEGSRTLTYRLEGTSLVSVDSNSSPFDQRNVPEVSLEPGTVLVELGHFCGKESTPMLIASCLEDLEGLVE